MAKAEEVQDNVKTIIDMVGTMQGVVDIAPAGDTDDSDQGFEQLQDTSSNSGPAHHKQAAKSGLSQKERELLASVREVLQPVRDVTWPVGLTDNRK